MMKGYDVRLYVDAASSCMTVCVPVDTEAPHVGCNIDAVITPMLASMAEIIISLFRIHCHVVCTVAALVIALAYAYLIAAQNSAA